MSDGWTATYEADVPGAKMRLEPGVEFALKGEKGKRYNFIRLVTNESGEVWVDCFGGNRYRQGSRSVPLDKIRPDSIKRLKRRDDG